MALTALQWAIMGKSKKRFLTAGIICIAGVAIGLIFAARSGSSPAAALRIAEYSNDQYGFSFYYPSDKLIPLPSQASGIMDRHIVANFGFPAAMLLSSTTGILPSEEFGTFISFSVSPDGTSTCQNDSGWDRMRSRPVEQPKGPAIERFHKGFYGTCATSVCYELTQYSVEHENRCYRATLDIDYGPAPIDEFTQEFASSTKSVQDSLSSLFLQVLSSFQFTR